MAAILVVLFVFLLSLFQVAGPLWTSFLLFCGDQIFLAICGVVGPFAHVSGTQLASFLSDSFHDLFVIFAWLADLGVPWAVVLSGFHLMTNTLYTSVAFRGLLWCYHQVWGAE